MVELLSCPFCGAVPIEKFNPLARAFRIRCEHSPCEIAPATGVSGNRESAIAAWNHRIDPTRDALVNALKDARYWIASADDKHSGHCANLRIR